MIRYFCDSCLNEFDESEMNNFEVPCHLVDPLGSGYIDKNFIPVSGRKETFHLCNSCLNIAYTAALESTKLLMDITPEKKMVINWNVYTGDNPNAGRYLVRLKYDKVSDFDYTDGKIVLLNVDDEGLWKDDVGININKNQVMEYISVNEFNAEKFQADLTPEGE